MNLRKNEMGGGGKLEKSPFSFQGGKRAQFLVCYRWRARKIFEGGGAF